MADKAVKGKRFIRLIGGPFNSQTFTEDVIPRLVLYCYKHENGRAYIRWARCDDLDVCYQASLDELNKQIIRYSFVPTETKSDSCLAGFFNRVSIDQDCSIRRYQFHAKTRKFSGMDATERYAVVSLGWQYHDSGDYVYVGQATDPPVVAANQRGLGVSSTPL